MKDLICVGLVDDDFLIVDLLKRFLEQQDNIQVDFAVISAQNAIELLEQCKQVPDLLLIDLKMEGMDGIAFCQYLKEHFPSIATIIVSSHYQDHFLGYMMKLGAAAFVAKGLSPTLLLRVIEEVHRNGFYLLPEQVQLLREQLPSSLPAPSLNPENLSQREIEVLKLIAEQKTAKEIAETLFITARTVEGHKNNLFVKTGTKNIAGLVLYAIQKKIIDPNEIFLNNPLGNNT
ncbi:response regulator [Sphingobacterium sp. DK4209]|uniref:Response regulator n=1 Tax=Sphingobacterium zhuxiongii TaxID=2662364 RepID=A0A5Q0QBL2_9SPHI|nr:MULTISPECIES: response regulator transcription factor [unclassified Sphingobacterium]MVZ64603.1 response regulator [Sphingobacterium sp. DK4209]QGA26943.1 response regulator [Sphingobacterium sp. dk4302]